MSQDNQDKHNALEAFLKSDVNDDNKESINIPDQMIKKPQVTSPIKTEEIEAEKAKVEVETEIREPNTSEKNKKTEAKNTEDEDTLIDRLSGLTSSAFKFAKKTTKTSLKVGKVLIQSQDQLKLMLAAGQSLKDLREVAGLTVSEMNDALNLKDKTLLEAVENGTSTLSFELILRISALLARNDPIPFIIKYTRTYNPEIWKILNDWGLGRLPLQYERERQFINIFRSHDEARKLSDDGYKKVLEFTQKAFDMSLHFIAEQENVAFGSNEESTNNK
jgi:transcriptional regulator with XRE-family HTH domain